MQIRCRCTSTCQFRGNVAEKGEVHTIDEELLKDKFIGGHFERVDTVQMDASKPPKRASRRTSVAPQVAVSASDLPFMREGV